MMPIIGPAPKHKNLWFSFGHAHHGLTLGPVTGRMVAEMVTGDCAVRRSRHPIVPTVSEAAASSSALVLRMSGQMRR